MLSLAITCKERTKTWQWKKIICFRCCIKKNCPCTYGTPWSRADSLRRCRDSVWSPRSYGGSHWRPGGSPRLAIAQRDSPSSNKISPWSHGSFLGAMEAHPSKWRLTIKTWGLPLEQKGSRAILTLEVYTGAEEFNRGAVDSQPGDMHGGAPTINHRDQKGVALADCWGRWGLMEYIWKGSFITLSKQWTPFFPVYYVGIRKMHFRIGSKIRIKSLCRLGGKIILSSLQAHGCDSNPECDKKKYIKNVKYQVVFSVKKELFKKFRINPQ